MPESALNISASRADNSSVGRIETEAHLLANKSSDATVKRMVKVSADPTYDASKIGEAETSASGDADPTVTNLKPVKSSIARNSLAEKQTRGNFIGDVTEAEEVSYFITGSSYKGSWDALGMAGVGRYVMPHGTAYEGEIRDGMFHGQGSLYWSKKNRLDVVHLRGKLRGHRYTFEDGLVYQDEDWSYCKFPDRRFYESVKKGLRPGGRTLKTAKQPTKVLPSGCYDAGDGAFDPKTLRITSYDNAEKVLRIPTKEESDWIVKNCRKSWSEPTGYRPSLNENWFEDPPELPYHIALSEDAPDPWWKRLTTFHRQFDTVGAEDDEDICNRTQPEDISIPEACMCGRYVILGEPCHCAAVATPFNNEDETEEMNDALESISHSSDYLDVKSVMRREKCKSIRTIDQQSSRGNELSAGVPECAETNTDDSVSVPEEFSEYQFSSEFVEDSDDSEKRREDAVEGLQMEAEEVTSKHVVGKKTLRKSARNRHGGEDGSGPDVSEETIVKKFVTENIEEIEEKLKYRTEEEVDTRRNEEKDARRECTLEEKNRKEEEELGTSGLKKNREEEVGKESVIVTQVEDRQTIDKERSEERGLHATVEEIVDRRKDGVTKKSRRIVGEESDEAEVGDSEDQLDELLPVKAVNEGREEKKDLSIPPLEDHDHAVASVRTEKVPIVTEPETSNGRRMELEGSTHLPKGETSERDLPYDRANEKAIGSAVIDDSAIRERVQENNDLGSVSSKTPQDIAVNVSPAAEDDKLHKVMLDEGEEIADAPENTQSTQQSDRSIDTVGQSKSNKYTEVSKASVRPGHKSVTKEAKFSELRRADNSGPRETDEEEMQTLKIISDSRVGSSSPMALGGTTSKDSQSRLTDEEMATEGNSVASKNDLPILEKLHQSLAVLSSDKQKRTTEKEIIEIYSKFSRMEKTKTVECSVAFFGHFISRVEGSLLIEMFSGFLQNVNVWRLAGAAQDGSQTKMEDPLLHPILAAPRCELIECTRKPRVGSVCKPTVPEVRTSGSRCRKEFPFDIPAKQSRSSAERIERRNK